VFPTIIEVNIEEEMIEKKEHRNPTGTTTTRHSPLSEIKSPCL